MSIDLTLDAGLATVILNNANKLNVLGLEELQEFNRIAQELEANAELRVILIRANGAVFGGGGDISCFRECTDPAKISYALGHEINSLILRLRSSRAVVVTEVFGAVIGGSMGLMNAADLVVAAKGTRFNLAYSGIGASPDAGSTWLMPRMAGVRKTLEWMVLSENFDADTAFHYGLVNIVVPFEQLRDVSDKLVSRLVKGPRESYARIKRLLYQSCICELDQQLEMETENFADISQSLDFKEGVTAFFAKRFPHFK